MGNHTSVISTGLVFDEDGRDEKNASGVLRALGKSTSYETGFYSSTRTRV